MKDLIIRFVLGGVIISAFAALGEVFKPKTFAGIFAAAPSVAIATLSLAFLAQGPLYVAASARAMVCAAGALIIYCLMVSALCERQNLPVSVTASGSWAVWGVTAIAGLMLARAHGFLP